MTSWSSSSSWWRCQCYFLSITEIIQALELCWWDVMEILELLSLRDFNLRRAEISWFLLVTIWWTVCFLLGFSEDLRRFAGKYWKRKCARDKKDTAVIWKDTRCSSCLHRLRHLFVHTFDFTCSLTHTHTRTHTVCILYKTYFTYIFMFSGLIY